jgi:hypothetical protein
MPCASSIAWPRLPQPQDYQHAGWPTSYHRNLPGVAQAELHRPYYETEICSRPVMYIGANQSGTVVGTLLGQVTDTAKPRMG